MEKYSWFTLDEKRVGKKLDYSAFKYNGTGVPKEFYNYFEIGDKDESIRFRCGDIEYNAEIKQDSYGRWQIRWDKTFTEILKEKFPEWKYLAPRSRLNSMRAIFAKTDHRNSYDISFIAEKNEFRETKKLDNYPRIVLLRQYPQYENPRQIPVKTLSKEIDITGVSAQLQQAHCFIWSINHPDATLVKNGDICLVGYGKVGRVVTTIDNEELSRIIFGSYSSVDSFGGGHSYGHSPGRYLIIFSDLKSIKEIGGESLCREDINLIIGWAPKAEVRGLKVIEKEASYKVLSHIGISDWAIFKEERKLRFQKKLNALDKTESRKESSEREEQSIFRDYLFGQHSEVECALCGKSLPIEIMVAAHIKPRSQCSNEEKRDINVVMPVCKLGCDELFEKKFLLVDNTGSINFDKRLESNSILKKFATDNIMKKCSFFNVYTKEYFLAKQENE